MNGQCIQQEQQAGHTKLTAVNIYASPGRRRTFFVPLLHNDKGQAILPEATLNRLLDEMRVRRGDTYSWG